MMKAMRIFLVILLCITVTSAKCQVVFQKAIGRGLTYTKSVAIYNKQYEKIIITGRGWFPDVFGNPTVGGIGFLKLDSIGNFISSKKIHTQNYIGSFGANNFVQFDSTDNIAICGTSVPYPLVGINATICIFDTAFNVLNICSYRFPGVNTQGSTTFGKILFNSFTKEYYLLGTKDTIENGQSFAATMLCKIDSNLNMIWSKVIMTGRQSVIDDFVLTGQGELLFYGLFFDSNSLIRSWLFKTDSAGSILWSKTLYTPGGQTYSGQIHPVYDGYVLGGSSYDSVPNSVCPSLVKVDTSGNIQWVCKFKAYSLLAINSLQLKDKGYVCSGLYNFGSFGSLVLTKIDSSGNLEWSRYYHNGNYVNQTSLLEGDDHSVYATGEAIFPAAGNTDTIYAYLLKADLATGSSECDETIIYPNVYRNNNFVSQIQPVISVDKFCQTIPLTVQTEQDTAYEYIFCQGTVSVNDDYYSKDFNVYPNPATDKVVIQNVNALNKTGSLALYDLTGRQIKSELNVSFPFELNLSVIKSGVYHLKVVMENKIFTTKIIALH